MPQALFVGIDLVLENAFGAFLIANSALLATASYVIGGLALSSNQAKKAKRKARDAFNAQQVDRLTNLNSTTGSRELVLGRVRKGGNVFYRTSTGTNKTSFIMLVALAGHEIDAVETIYLNDVAVTLDGSGNVTDAPYGIGSVVSGIANSGVTGVVTLAGTPVPGTVYAFIGTDLGPDGNVVQVEVTLAGAVATTSPNALISYQYTSYTSNANIRAVLGTDSQAADAATMAALPASWTSAHRARGVAYLVCRFEFNETTFPGGLPTVTAVVRGAKVYDPRENRLIRSEEFDSATWTKNSVTVSAPNTVTNPYGVLTAEKVVESVASTFHFVAQEPIAISVGAIYTFAIHGKPAGRNFLQLLLDDGGSNGGYATFDLSLGTVTESGTYGTGSTVSSGIEVVGGSYFRCYVTSTAGSSSGSARLVALLCQSGTAGIAPTYLGDGVSGIQLWGASFVAGSTPKTYCRTSASAIAPTTAWSDNPALLMRHVYQHDSFGKASPSAAEDDRIIAAANACDTSTNYLAGGVTETHALYRAAVVVPFGAAAKDVFDDLAQAMAGSWAFAGGEFYAKAGTWMGSVMDLTDSDLAVIVRNGAEESQHPISISVHRERNQKFNTVNVQIYDQAQDYKQVTLTPLTSSALVTADGAALAQGVTYDAIGYAPQALHVAGVMMRDARDPLTVVLPFKLRAYPLELFDTVSLTLSRYGWSSKLFQVIAREWTADGQLTLTLKETAESIYTMDAEFDAQGGASNTGLPSPWYVPTVGALTVTSGTDELIRQADGTISSRMRVSWPAVDDSSVTQGGTIELQYRDVLNTGDWTPVVCDGSQTQVVITAVQDSAWYTIRVRARNRLAVGQWGTQVVHQVIGKTEAPPPFDSFLVLAQPDGTRQYNFSYADETLKPIDWLGAEIRYVGGTTGSPDWDTMTPLVDTTTYFTGSPVELNAPLAGEYTFACKSVDTSGNKSTYLVQNITLTARRLGSVFDEYYEHTEGWLGTLTGCRIQDGILQSIDTTTWATAPATWTGFTRWNYAPTSPIYYETPARDFGAAIVGGVSSTVDADGTVVTELATSADGSTWSSWGSAAAQFNSRYIKLRITVTATGPAPVPVVREWSYTITAPIRSEYINDVVISALTGSYRIGTGDIRIPLVGTYTVLKKTDVTVQDSTAGAWVATRIDQTLTYGPRWQFRLNGVLTDPAYVDFYVEGY